MADLPQEENCPPNMVIAFKQLRAIYGEGGIPLVLGTELHGARTDMKQVEVGKDQMMLCILPNYHGVPDEYRDSAPFFVLGHEFGHIVSHPGKDAVYWREGMQELPVEHFQKGKWFNCVSDIIVNWTVMTGSNIVIESQKATIQPQMLNGFMASEFVRSCGDNNEGRPVGYDNHARMLKEGKLKDNRYCPKGGKPGQYDEADPSDPYKPTPMTPFYQRYQGHGRGEQYYPPLSYCVATKQPENWKRIRAVKSEGPLKKGKNYTVESTKTFDGRIDSERFEPIHQYKIKGEWVSARYCQTLCPQCGNVANNTWDNWWLYVPKKQMEQRIEAQGTWVFLLIQMFAFQWAAIYSTFFDYGGLKDRSAGEKFLKDISEEMNNVMRMK